MAFFCSRDLSLVESQSSGCSPLYRLAIDNADTCGNCRKTFCGEKPVTASCSLYFFRICSFQGNETEKRSFFFGYYCGNIFLFIRNVSTQVLSRISGLCRYLVGLGKQSRFGLCQKI